jgi:hypothetical protein
MDMERKARLTVQKTSPQVKSLEKEKKGPTL